METLHRHRWLTVVAATAGVIVLLAIAGGFDRATAQESEGLPAQIHAGTCDALGEVAFELTGVGATVGLDGTVVPEVETVGPPTALAVAISQTTIEAAISDVVDGGHAIAVYASDEIMDEPIACGDVGGPQTIQMAGMLMPGDELVVGLAERGESGFAGIAILRAAGGSEASVTIYLARGLATSEGAGLLPPSAG